VQENPGKVFDQEFTVQHNGKIAFHVASYSAMFAGPDGDEVAVWYMDGTGEYVTSGELFSLCIRCPPHELSFDTTITRFKLRLRCADYKDGGNLVTLKVRLQCNSYPLHESSRVESHLRVQHVEALRRAVIVRSGFFMTEKRKRTCTMLTRHDAFVLQSMQSMQDCCLLSGTQCAVV
jgi:hypothetical protein